MIGNGNLLVGYDADYNVRDLFFPYVGMENPLGRASDLVARRAGGDGGRLRQEAGAAAPRAWHPEGAGDRFLTESTTLWRESPSGIVREGCSRACGVAARPSC